MHIIIYLHLNRMTMSNSSYLSLPVSISAPYCLILFIHLIGSVLVRFTFSLEFLRFSFVQIQTKCIEHGRLTAQIYFKFVNRVLFIHLFYENLYSPVTQNKMKKIYISIEI